MRGVVNTSVSLKWNLRSKGCNMKITWTGECGAKIVANNPDQKIKEYFKQQISDAYYREVNDFMEEVSVAIRKIKKGETITLTSRPIVITIVNEETEPQA